MKRTITRLSSILAIITLLFVFGCTEDLYQDENHANQNLKFKHYTKTFDYLTKDKTFINSFNKIPKKQKNVASAELSRTIMENQYGFTILDTPINIMESDSIISYNLLIKSDTLSNDTFFENLVVNTNKFTSETSAFKIKYNSNYSTSFNLEAQIAPIIYNNTESVSSKFGMICHTLHYCLCHETVVGTIYEEPHTPTEACSGNSFVYYAETICINTGGSGTNSDSGSGIYTPSSYYGGGHSGSNIYVNPTPPIINNIKKRKMNFGSQLTQPQKDWLYNTNNVDAQTSIYDYLENSLTNADGLILPLSVENYPQEAVDFVLEAIDALINNGEVDFDDEIILDLTIVNNQKVKCVYEKLKSLESNFFNNLLENNFGDKKEANIKFYIENIDNQYLARTIPNINGTSRFYKIIFDTDFVSTASTIELAVAFIHEVYHAELYERMYKLGLINVALPDGSIIFNDLPTTYQLNDEIINQLVLHYTTFVPTSNNPSNYQHNLFNILGYRNNIITTLNELQPLLDPQNYFQSIVDNDPLITNLGAVFNNIAWYGLEETDEYQNLSPLNILNINHSNDKVKQFYSQTCN